MDGLVGRMTPSSGILVYYIDRFDAALHGCGGQMTNRPACIVARAGTRYCTAHEVCHVLLGSTFAPVHIGDPSNNLMHPVDFVRSAPPVLADLQVERIKPSPLCTAIWRRDPPLAGKRRVARSQA